MAYLHIDKVTIAWLAGLLEGKGCFTYACSPGIKLGMTDRDVVHKVALIWGRYVRGPYQYPHNRKPVYYTEVWAGHATGWMMTMLPFFSTRCSDKVREIIRRWRDAPTKAHRRGYGRKTECHPERKHYAHGLCAACYKRQRRQQKGVV